MPATQDTYTYACGCITSHGVWTLCADCSARIGHFGTCLQCGGPANEQWTHPELDESLCSSRCAILAVVDARDAR